MTKTYVLCDIDGCLVQHDTTGKLALNLVLVKELARLQKAGYTIVLFTQRNKNIRFVDYESNKSLDDYNIANPLGTTEGILTALATEHNLKNITVSTSLDQFPNGENYYETQLKLFEKNLQEKWAAHYDSDVYSCKLTDSEIATEIQNEAKFLFDYFKEEHSAGEEIKKLNYLQFNYAKFKKVLLGEAHKLTKEQLLDIINNDFNASPPNFDLVHPQSKVGQFTHFVSTLQKNEANEDLELIYFDDSTHNISEIEVELKKAPNNRVSLQSHLVDASTIAEVKILAGTEITTTVELCKTRAMASNQLTKEILTLKQKVIITEHDFSTFTSKIETFNAQNEISPITTSPHLDQLTAFNLESYLTPYKTMGIDAKATAIAGFIKQKLLNINNDNSCKDIFSYISTELETKKLQSLVFDKLSPINKEKIVKRILSFIFDTTNNNLNFINLYPDNIQQALYPQLIKKINDLHIKLNNAQYQLKILQDFLKNNSFNTITGKKSISSEVAAILGRDDPLPGLAVFSPALYILKRDGRKVWDAEKLKKAISEKITSLGKSIGTLNTELASLLRQKTQIENESIIPKRQEKKSQLISSTDKTLLTNPADSNPSLISNFTAQGTDAPTSNSFSITRSTIDLTNTGNQYTPLSLSNNGASDGSPTPVKANTHFNLNYVRDSLKIIFSKAEITTLFKSSSNNTEYFDELQAELDWHIVQILAVIKDACTDSNQPPTEQTTSAYNAIKVELDAKFTDCFDRAIIGSYRHGEIDTAMLNTALTKAYKHLKAESYSIAVKHCQDPTHGFPEQLKTTTFSKHESTEHRRPILQALKAAALTAFNYLFAVDITAQEQKVYPNKLDKPDAEKIAKALAPPSAGIYLCVKAASTSLHQFLTGGNSIQTYNAIRLNDFSKT